VTTAEDASAAGGPAALAGNAAPVEAAAGVAPAVRLVGVEKRFGQMVAVRGVDLEIGPTEFVTFLGPSGCGKTTTLRILAGLERPTGGEVWIGGRLVNDVPPHARNIPLVFQHFVLFPHLNVRRNVAYGLDVRRVEKAERNRRVAEVLAFVGLEGLAERRVNELSGGQQQRVALARAIVVRPSVLLLDEPLGSLDAYLRVRMQTELRAMQQGLGIPFVYVTHNQNEALAMSDKVVVMNDGRIEQIDPPSILFRHPKTRFVAQFVGNNNIVEAMIVDVVADAVRIDTALGRFSVRRATGSSFRPGERCAAVFNADRLTLSEREDDAHRFRAEVVGIESVGSIVTCLLQTGNQELHLELHGRAGADAAVGREVFVSVNPEAIVLLEEDRAPRKEA
jgi:spermidine/putrescine transport system ATP-binding protein